MENKVLNRVKQDIEKYKGEHRGDKPLYIIMASEEADRLMTEVKKEKGYDDQMVVTEFNGSKIVKHPAIKKGDIQLSNELPEASG